MSCCEEFYGSVLVRKNRQMAYALDMWKEMCIIDVIVKNCMNIIIPRALIFYCYKMDIYNLYYVCVLVVI